MHAHTRSVRTLALVAALSLQAGLAFAGRPLVVDDAGTNDKGKGHVEAWVTRVDGTSLYSLAPAYAFGEGLEVSGLLARESSTDLRATALQLKWRITPSQENGCNYGVVAGVSRVSVPGASARATYLNGLFTCNRGDAGSYHFNLGVTKPEGASTGTNWGVAYERAFGAVTPHIEWFGSEGSKPTVQFGLRGNVLPNLQLDGSVGRSDGITIYTLGVKFMF